MRIFLAGATSKIGVRLIPLMLAAGHEIAGMTRSEVSGDLVRALGAAPVLCDAYDAEALSAHVRRVRPDLVMHQMTDLPDDPRRLPDHLPRHERIRTEGTRNLLAAARAAGLRGLVLQSIAWPGGSAPQPWSTSPVIQPHERMVLDAGGTVLRYGQFYGPGTYFEHAVPGDPRIHIDEAARRTMDWLACGLGVVEVVE